MKEFILHYWLEVFFSLVAAGLAGGYRCLSARVQKQVNTQKNLCEGTKALLRNEVIRNYDKYISQGWMPIYARENVMNMYESYHALGGNGSITQLMNELAELRSKEEEEE